MFTYYMQFNASIARLLVKSNKVAQLNAKFRLTLNWTLLRLFDFMIIAQFIVKFAMDLANPSVVNMLVMKTTA